MKYKNIYSAIHNLGHSFLSSMNYVDDGYVFDDLKSIHIGGNDITIDWLEGTFDPDSMSNRRLENSIGYYLENLDQHFTSLNVDIRRLNSLKFHWPAGERKYMEAIDDRGKRYKIYVRESK